LKVPLTAVAVETFNRVTGTYSERWEYRTPDGNAVTQSRLRTLEEREWLGHPKFSGMITGETHHSARCEKVTPRF
jgi:hypothetical protein